MTNQQLTSRSPINCCKSKITMTVLFYDKIKCWWIFCSGPQFSLKAGLFFSCVTSFGCRTENLTTSQFFFFCLFVFSTMTKKQKQKKHFRPLRLASKVAPTKCCCDNPDCWVTSKYQMVDSLRQVNKAPGSQRFSLLHALLYLCPHKCNLC